MKRGVTKRLRNDIILIGILILVPLIMLLFVTFNNDRTGTEVIISVDGKVYQTTPLAVNREITVISDVGTNLVVIHDGRVSMTDADCPERLCVSHRAISKRGEQIVCLPHRVVVRITGGDDNDIDSISH